MKITKNTLISEALKINPKSAEILMSRGMGCMGCPSAQMESLEQASEIHGLNLEELLEDLNRDIEHNEVHVNEKLNKHQEDK